MAVSVDTEAWFAFFVRRDPDHSAAVVGMDKNRERLVTTDYVMGELLTHLLIRENHLVAVAAGEVLWNQEVADLERITDHDLGRAWSVFQQRHDKKCRFTDCTNKVVTERMSISKAFAFDHHFERFATVSFANSPRHVPRKRPRLCGCLATTFQTCTSVGIHWGTW